MALASPRINMIDSIPAVFDRSHSRNKWVSIYRENFVFTGRDNPKNSNEYARIGMFTSNQSGVRLEQNMILVSISVQTRSSATWSAEIRKNGSTNPLTAINIIDSVGAIDSAANVDFNANDEVQVFIRGENIDRPVIKLVFAQRF